MSDDNFQILKNGFDTYKLPYELLSKFQNLLSLINELKPYIYKIEEEGIIPFDDLKQLIDEKFPETSATSTNKTTYQNLKSIFTSLNSDEFDLNILHKTDLVEQMINNKTDSNNSKSSYYNAILKAFQMYQMDMPRFYYDKLNELKEIKTESMFKMSDKDSNNLKNLIDNISTLEEKLISAVDSDPSFENHQKLTLFYLYIEVPPIRRDYVNMSLNSNNNKLNWVDTSTGIVYMNIYKNVKSKQGGSYMFDIKLYPKAWKAFQNFINIHPFKSTPCSHLILSNKNKPLNPSNFNKLLSSVFFTGCGVDLLRKYYLSKIVDVEDIKQQDEIARIMRHSIRTRNENYIKELPS